jgi:hypothetical protein
MSPFPLFPLANPTPPSVFVPLSKPAPLSKPIVRWQRPWLAALILTGVFVMGLVVGRATHSDSPFAPGAKSILEFPSGRVPWFAWAGADADQIVEAQANLGPGPGPNDLKWKQRIMDLVESGRVVTCENGLRVQRVSGEARVFSGRVLILDGTYEGRAVWVESFFLREPLAAEIHPTPKERQAEFKAALEALAAHR